MAAGVPRLRARAGGFAVLSLPAFASLKTVHWTVFRAFGAPCTPSRRIPMI